MRALQALLTDLATDTANIRDRLKCQMFRLEPVIKAGGGSA
jgi:hypothetical protein